MQILQTTSKALTSLEIAKITGKRHDHILRDIKLMIEGLEIERPQIWGGYEDAKGEKRKLATLDKELSLTLVSGYNIKLRNAIIRRWTELEDIHANPQNYIEALEELVRFAKKNKNFEIQIKELEPKALVADTFLSGKKDEMPIHDWANGLGAGLGRNTLYEILRFKKYLYKRQNNLKQPVNTPYQHYLDTEHFRVIFKSFEKVPGEFESYKATLITKKGIQFFTKKKLLEWKEEMQGGKKLVQTTLPVETVVTEEKTIVKKEEPKKSMWDKIFN